MEDAHGGETVPGIELELVADDARCAAQLARLLGVHPSSVSRTLSSAAGRGICLPPHTVDPVTKRRSFSATAFLEPSPHKPKSRNERILSVRCNGYIASRATIVAAEPLVSVLGRL
ncbi:hypothetical protein [Actinocorallia libanotica]